MNFSTNLTSRNDAPLQQLSHRSRTAEATPTIDLTRSTQIVFIDRQLADYEVLAAGVLADIEVYLLDPGLDGIRQITQVLATRRSIDTIHLVSHGSAGSIQLGSTDLSVESIDRYSQELQQWAARLAPDAVLSIYGCEVGKGDRGAALVYRLSELLGVSVAASETKTGSAALDGNWELEVRTGKQPVRLAFRADAIAAYQGVMATINGTPGNDNLKGDSNLTARENDTISGLDGDDTINGGLGIDSVNGGADSDTLIIDYSSQAFAGITTSISEVLPGVFQGNLTAVTDALGNIDRVTFFNMEKFQITGTKFNDNINLLPNGSTIDAGLGIDTLVTADFSSLATDVTVNEGGNLSFSDGTVLKNFEQIVNTATGAGNDTVTLLGDYNKTIATGGGNDTINAGLGINTVNGQANNDTLIIDYSSQIFAGAGITTSISEVLPGVFQGNLTAVTDALGNIDRVSFFNIEKFQITGTKFNDNISLLPIGSTIDAGLGIDTLVTADFSTLTSDVTVNEGGNLTFSDGTVLKNFERFITTTTGAGNDTVTLLGDYNKTIATGGGNDTINSGLGINTVNGQADNDTLIIDYSSQAFAGITTSISEVLPGVFQGNLTAVTDAAGNIDRVTFFNIEKFQITGTKFNDNISLLPIGSTIDAGMGIDTLVTADFSSLATDVTVNEGGNLTFSDGTTLKNFEQIVNTTTGAGNDTVTLLGDYNKTIATGNGNDTINAGLGINTVNGQADSDTLIIDYSSQAFAGITTSISEVSTGVFQGSLTAQTDVAGNIDRVTFFNIEKFQITGTKFNDNISLLPIGSTIDAGMGIDTLVTADFSSLATDVTVNEGGNLTFSDGTTLKNFEQIVNTTTGAGNDTVTLLGDYNKTIATGNGNDTINAGLGINTVNGQADSDTLIIDYSSQAFAGITTSISEVSTGVFQGSLTAQTDVAGNIDRVTFFNIEKFQITGTKFKDNIRTGGNDDTITGGGGADDLLGGAGNDTYIVDRTKGGGTVINDLSGTNDTLTLVGGANFSSSDTQRSGTTLLIDLNKDGIFNAATDLSILNYYAATTGAALGTGLIENINSLNLAPVGTPTATLANTPEDTAITINASDLLAGFSDPNGDTLLVSNLVATNGTLVNNNDGTYKFTPTTDFSGTVNLTYGVTDGLATLAGQTRSFSVTPATRIGVSNTIVNAAEPGTRGEFTLTRTNNTAAALTIDYTISGTATNGVDYQNLTGTATFAPGATQAKVEINPTDDNTAEGTETVILTLATGTGYKLEANTTATLSLLDNETQPTIGINNVSQNEGNSGTTNFGFNLTLSTASTQTISVQYATADGTATAGSDYTAKTGTVTFNPGETSKMVDVVVLSDTTVEASETFTLNLSGALNATLANSFGTGTILNDDTVVTGGPIFLTAFADNYTATGADEVIYALAGNDIVNGGGGNDTIYGGAGVDLLYGGTGNDVFGFLNPTDGIDKIFDFVVGEDKIGIDFDGFGGTSVFSTDSVGVLASSRFTLGTIATTASQRFIYNDRSGALFFDADGANGANQVRIAQLVGNPTLSSNSFILNTTSVG